MDVRIRLPELLKEHELTAYEVAKRSGGRISTSALYRLNSVKGRVDLFSATLLEALCDVFNCEPGELLERTGKGRK